MVGAQQGSEGMTKQAGWTVSCIVDMSGHAARVALQTSCLKIRSSCIMCSAGVHAGPLLPVNKVESREWQAHSGEAIRMLLGFWQGHQGLKDLHLVQAWLLHSCCKWKWRCFRSWNLFLPA